MIYPAGRGQAPEDDTAEKSKVLYCQVEDVGSLRYGLRCAMDLEKKMLAASRIEMPDVMPVRKII